MPSGVINNLEKILLMIKQVLWRHSKIFEPAHNKIYHRTWASKDSDQPVHPPSLIRVFTNPMSLLEPLGYPKSNKQKPSLDWVDVQADLNPCWSYRSYCRYCYWLAHFSSTALNWSYDIVWIKWNIAFVYNIYIYIYIYIYNTTWEILLSSILQNRLEIIWIVQVQ